MLRDDASPEERERWFRRTPQEIEDEKTARWNDAWSALRLPEHLAREPDTMAGGGGDDVLLGGAGKDRIARKRDPAAAITALDPYQRALLDTIAGTESPGYDVLYSPGATLRRIKPGADGLPDYSRHPNDPAVIAKGPNKGKLSSAAGRYQFLNGTWKNLADAHKDLTDFTPASQDRAAIYLASERYARETGRDLTADLRDPQRYGAIAGALRKEWTSLPGGIEQGQGMSAFAGRMSDGIRRYGRQ